MAVPGIASVRTLIADLLRGAASRLGTRAALLQLLDALDRLEAQSHQPWYAAPSWSDLQREAAQEASAEFAKALLVARPLLPAATLAPLETIAQAVSRRLAQRAHRTRSCDARLASAAGARAWADSPSALDALEVPPDPARFGASAPRTVRPGIPFVARFVAYPQSQSDQAAAMLEHAGERSKELGVGSALLRAGARVDVRCAGQGLRVEDEASAVQSLYWTGQLVVLNFAAVTEDLREGDATLVAFDVMVDGVPLAGIRLEIEVGTAASAGPRTFETGCELARRAFASYSSRDRARVLDRVAAIRLAAAVEVFLDCHDLNPGEAWKQRLADEIDRCDCFMLFWSKAAELSEWVRWEWERALKHRGLERMQFHPLQNGVKPPRELASIHVGDPYMDLRLADRLRNTATVEET